jgi:hypothetical protein
MMIVIQIKGELDREKNGKSPNLSTGHLLPLYLQLSKNHWGYQTASRIFQAGFGSL